MYDLAVGEWGFLTNHARALTLIAADPGVRLRDLATRLDVTERSAFGLVTDLAAAGYIVKEKAGRRNRYRIQPQVRLHQVVGREQTVGDLLALLVGSRSEGSDDTLE
jgi:DNA-binding IclR family transcriptional regulator